MAAARKRDYYEILGVGREAPKDEIRKAYLRLAHKYHPDKTGGDKRAEERLKEINEAYDTLKKPEKRKEYDQMLDAAMHFGGGPGAGAEGFSGFDFGQGAGSGAFDSIFETIFGRGGAQARPTRATPGNDVEVRVRVSFRDAAFGATKRIRVPTFEACSVCKGSGAAPGYTSRQCPDCGGSGQVQQFQGYFNVVRTCHRCRGRGNIISSPCSQCGGTGEIRRAKDVTVSIPPGVNTGTRLRIAGLGEPGPSGGRRGDLYVSVEAQKDPFFEREGRNVVCEIPVRLSEAALGAKVRVPTLNGEVELSIPPGTQTGATLRLRGLGVEGPKGQAPGDQLVRVVVETPVHLSPEERALLERLEQATRPEAYPKRRRFDRRQRKE